MLSERNFCVRFFVNYWHFLLNIYSRVSKFYKYCAVPQSDFETLIFTFFSILVWFFEMGEKEGNTAQPQRMKFYDAQTGELLGRTAGSWGEYFQKSFLENFYKKSNFYAWISTLQNNQTCFFAKIVNLRFILYELKSLWKQTRSLNRYRIDNTLHCISQFFQKLKKLIKINLISFKILKID